MGGDGLGSDFYWFAPALNGGRGQSTRSMVGFIRFIVHSLIRKKNSTLKNKKIKESDCVILDVEGGS